MGNKALPTAGLVVVKGDKLLLAYSKNKKAWYLPGGKIDEGESSLETLQREIFEELNIVLNAERLKYYCHITAPAYGEEPPIIMEQDCFISFTLTSYLFIQEYELIQHKNNGTNVQSYYKLDEQIKS